MMTAFDIENDNLRSSWDRHSCDHLDSYLVSDVEDPRINCQSILSRALIADSLWPNEFTDLIDAELRFGAVLTWLLTQLKKGTHRYDLVTSIDNDTGRFCPLFVRETYRWLQSDKCPIVDYLSTALDDVDPDNPEQLICERALDTFSEIWRMILEKRHPMRIRILEPACGSANDYRFIDKCGLSKSIDYTGIDISINNITNARMHFPDIDFRAASIIESGFANESFDYLFVHDLFEHLSPEAVVHVLSEVLRVVRHQVWLHFFNVSIHKDHLIRSTGRYYWNTLSLDELCQTIKGLGGEVEVLPISRFLKEKFRDCDYYNPGAFTLLVAK